MSFGLWHLMYFKTSLTVTTYTVHFTPHELVFESLIVIYLIIQSRWVCKFLSPTFKHFETNFIFTRLISVVISSTLNYYNDIINVEYLQWSIIFLINLEKPILVIGLFLLFSNDLMFCPGTLLLKMTTK